MPKSRKEEVVRLNGEGGLMQSSAICWDTRLITASDATAARRWLVQQLAKTVLQRMREEDAANNQ